MILHIEQSISLCVITRTFLVISEIWWETFSGGSEAAEHTIGSSCSKKWNIYNSYVMPYWNAVQLINILSEQQCYNVMSVAVVLLLLD